MRRVARAERPRRSLTSSRSGSPARAAAGRGRRAARPQSSPPRRSPRSPPRPRSRTTSPSRRACAARPSSVRERQRGYVDDFRDAAPVLDVGCGRGELLGLLREAGVEARGIDADADMVAYARGEGLDVEQADALAYLESLDDGSLGGIFAGQVVEHLPPATLVRAARARRREAPAGRPARRRDDQPALAARPPQLLRRPHARAAARSRDAGAAREAGRLPRGRDALPERARRAARDPRRPDDRRERPQAERHPVRAARLRDPRARR